MIDKIKSRYSCRNFSEEENEVSDDDLEQILQCGRWAPSGLNNQPWRFMIIKDDKTIQNQLADCTKSDQIIRQAAINVIVLLDLDDIYSRIKDIQSIGACIENMLIAAHDLGYGTCWLGEILNQSGDVLDILGLNAEKYELMAVISIGVPKLDPPTDRERKPLADLILRRI